MKFSFLVRSRIILGFVLLFSLVLVAKVFLVQIVHGSFYKEVAFRQYATPPGNIFERGTIYFARKDGELVAAATQANGYKVAINVSKVPDAEKLYQAISKIAQVDYGKFVAKAGKVTDPYEEIANHLTKAEADAISALALPGVSIFKEKWRFYPGGRLASNALGLVAYKGDELGGRYGVERQYEAVLARNQNSAYVNFFAEVFSNINQTFFDRNEKEGNVVTTLEPEVQNFLEKKMNEVKERYAADLVGGIVMSPRDGSIYALGVKPDFNPNDFSQVKSATLFANPLVENVLEFGSVVKPLNMAAALDAGVVTANTTYNDRGSVVVEKKEIFNFDKQGRGPGTTMQEVLNQSLNTGMVFVEQRLGRERLKEYLLAYGIDDKTGIDLPNETSGLVSNLNSPREIEFANASFGQGIALTPIEMVRALASLANGGKLVVPHVVSKIKYEDGTFKNISYGTENSKISKETAEEITRMLVNVMDQSVNKAGFAKLENWSIAVKTGTAQVANNIEGGYYEDRHTHSFFGYFPAYKPEFIIFLYAVNPKGVRFAVETWANPFFDLTKFLLNYYNIPPDR